MQHLHTEEHAGLKILIDHDQDCESPLPEDGDNGVFITYKRGSRYVLGNQPVEQEEFEEIVGKIRSGEYIGLPVYAYVHSGVALRCSSWHGSLPQGHAEFDSGMSGVVYISKRDALAWQVVKRLSKQARKRMEDSLRSVVSEMSSYLNGECYGYTIESEDGEHLDSCWGFIGFEYVMQQAKESAEDFAKQRAEEKRADWLAALREARERHYWLQRGVMTV